LAQDIGSAVSIVPAVDAFRGGQRRTLTIGAAVVQNERVQTAVQGSARLKFRDDTTLNIGPNAAVTLDRFVYNPDATASQSVMTATRGAFRFATGKSDKGAYQINTPVATIGVRGTVIDFVIEGNRLRIRSVVGQAFVCRRSAGNVGTDTARRRGCRAITPEDGTFVVTLNGFAPGGGNIFGQLDDVHQRLNIAAGLPLADPGNATTGGADLASGGTPGDPLSPGSPFTPPSAPPPSLVAGPTLGSAPSDGFSTAPNDPSVFMSWRSFPGIPCGTGCGIIGSGGVVSYASVFGSPFVKFLLPFEKDTTSPNPTVLNEPLGNPAFIMGRWTGDVKVVDSNPDTPDSLSVHENGGIHFLVGRLTGANEFGLASGATGPVDLTYSLFHATKPTHGGSFDPGSSFGRSNRGSGAGSGGSYFYPYAPGTFTGDMKVRMLSSTFFVALKGSVTMPLAGSFSTTTPAPVIYAFETNGGLANPSLSEIKPTSATPADGHQFDSGSGHKIKVTRDGSACAACGAFVIGHFFGSSYQFAGINYDVVDEGETFTGAAVFSRAAGSAAGSGDTVLLPRMLTMQGIGDLSTLTAAAIAANDKLVLNPTGDLYRAGKTGGVALHRLTAKRTEAGVALDAGTGAPIIGWERWTEGWVDGSLKNHFQGNTGVHLVHGEPATALPTSGTFTYSLLGATAPTIRDGSQAPGSFTGQMAVQFGTNAKVGVDFQVGIGGHSYNVKSAGGVATPGSSQINLSPTGVFAVSALPVAPGGPACASGSACSANVNGFLAGQGGMFAGVGYAIGQAGGTGAKVVSGTAAFKR
jgi:hypothetical protein